MRTAGDEAGRKEIRAEFGRVVTMTPAELERWLESEHGREVGRIREGESESVGHQEGRRIVEMRRKKAADLTDDDHAHMRRVVGHRHRHLARRPDGDVTETRWGYSLMNRGHDPLKDRGRRGHDGSGQAGPRRTT